MATSLRLIIKGCVRCRGDLKYDMTEGEFVCLLCGRTHNPKPIPTYLFEISDQALYHHKSRTGHRRLGNPRSGR